MLILSFCLIDKKLIFIKNNQKLSQVDTKIPQNWLCSYQPSMEPTTATPRLFVTTTTTTNMTRRTETMPWRTIWIHTSILRSIYPNLWQFWLKKIEYVDV